MAYRIKREDPDPAASLRRIALEQIDKALADLDNTALERDERVRALRKRCKKLRGLIRLVRPAFERYDRTNETLRDAARALSALRDRKALQEAFNGLIDGYEDVLAEDMTARIHNQLTQRQTAFFAPIRADELLDAFRETISGLRAEAEGWTLSATGFDAYAVGVKKVYRQARASMREVQRGIEIEAMHEWCKRVKYHWYHARLLAPVCPEPMKTHVEAANALGKLLGAHHDLAELGLTLRAWPEERIDRPGRDVLLGLVALKMARLEQRAREEGARLFADTPNRLVERWHSHWTAWQRQ